VGRSVSYRHTQAKVARAEEAAQVLREYLRATPIVKSYFDAAADTPLGALRR
jgi:hypothetical protein